MREALPSVHVGLYDPVESMTWHQVEQVAARLREQIVATGARAVLFSVHSGCELVVGLHAVRGLRRDVVLVGRAGVPRSALPVDVDCVVSFDGPTGAVPRPHPTGAPAGPQSASASASNAVPPTDGGVWIFSSGTTGVPQATRWAWPELTRGRPWNGPGRHEVWAIGYTPFGFAGISATCQALGRAAYLEYLRPEHLAIREGRSEHLDVVAGTPSFWRMAIINARRRNGRLRRMDIVSMGGEPADRKLLDAIRAELAPQRVKQIFATTEFGRLFAVDDGLPGLPLDRSGQRLGSGVAFDVRQDRLLVSTGPGEPFRETWDPVRVVAGRVHVMGRDAVRLNVGGHKVDPVFVAQVVQEHPRVLAARAYGVPSPIVGEVVAIDVVVDPSTDCSGDADLGLELKRYAGTRLAPHERPRRVRIVDELSTAPSGKVSFRG